MKYSAEEIKRALWIAEKIEHEKDYLDKLRAECDKHKQSVKKCEERKLNK